MIEPQHVSRTRLLPIRIQASKQDKRQTESESWSSHDDKVTIMQLQVRNHQEIIWVSHVPCRAIYSTASSKQEYMPESEKGGHSRSRRPKHPATS